MEGRPPKPKVGDLVRIDKDYPNTQASGALAIVVKTLGVECVVQPVARPMNDTHGKPWWFPRTYLEVINANR